MRALRPRAAIDYAAIEENDELQLEESRDASRFAAALASRLPALGPARVTTLPEGAALTLPWLRAHGLREPVLVLSRRGLGLRVPPPAFTVCDVARACGEAWPIEVLDVAAQSEVPGSWTLGDWARFYHTPVEKRRRVLNVITLEFSGTPLARLVRAPRFVRSIDWTCVYILFGCLRL